MVLIAFILALLVIWLVTFLAAVTLGGLTHLLLVIAVVLGVIQLVRSRKARPK